MDELAKDSRVAAAYDLWYRLREEVLRTYKNDLPPRLPISQQKEFKRIKNLVIEEAVRLGEYTEVFTPTDIMEQEADEAEPELDGDSISEDEPQKADANDSQPTLKWNDRCAPQAKYRVAKRILSDSNTKPEQIANAMVWLTQAAEAGLDYAQYALGKLYWDGGPVEQDPVKAVIWFAQAAEQDNQYAMYALGKLYLEAEDSAKALRWFRRAAGLGNQFAQYRLGKLLLSGDGIQKDAANAVRWLTQSAEQGNQYAQYALGKLFLLGRDVQQDRKAATRWFTMAAEQGNQYAKYFLDQMNEPPPLFTSATRLLRHMGNVFRDQAPPPANGFSFVDSKLRRKIREKKIAMGHKADDHEEQNIQQYW